jgi:hypothetical protein
MGWMVWGLVPVRARFSTPVQTGPGVHPASCTMGTRSFPGLKSGQGVTLTPHPLLVLWLRKGRAISLLPLWAVQPVQSLGACTRVHFTYWYVNSLAPLFHHRACCYQYLFKTNACTTKTHINTQC